MSNSKHTPGSWSIPHFAKADCKCDCRYVLSEGYCGSICTIDIDNGKAICDGGNDSPPLEEAIANAHLIAAAPELLEAAELAYRYINNDGKIFQGGQIFLINEKPIIDKLKQAIAKAKEEV